MELIVWLLKTVSKLFNCCLTNGYFPKVFKNAKVIPILKNGKDPKNPTSYRPISILSKLFTAES